jgi:hypothetical protein
MIPYDLDPSLHSGEPVRQLLNDGFSPPSQECVREQADKHPAPAPTAPVDPALWAKSAF